MNEAERIAKACCGDPQAMEFIALWAEYCHAIDDIVDQENTCAEHIIRTCGPLPVMLCTHPFFVRTPMHAVALRQVMLLVANAYADSVAWERSASDWQRNHSDVLRHAGNEMIFAVAQICGGYEHARKISLEQRTVCHLNQHANDKEAE